jgi:pyruvate dehydrogenase E2 component (dihydrolipoamide acetyltransferase)
MAIDLMMPALSPTMEKGTLARWRVAVGDTIKPGDLLAEIETDKATMEFEAVNEGRIAELLVQEGTDDVPVGAIIARLADGEAAPAEDDKPLSPSARRAAKATGIDPTTVNGTGRDGRVTREDLVAASGTVPAIAPAVTQDIVMPALSPTMEKGTIARWLVAVGDTIKAGDLIAEIETDKATMELEAAADGRLSEILQGDGTDDIAVGTVIARVSDAGSGTRSPAVAAPVQDAPAPGGGEVAQLQPVAAAKPAESAPPAPRPEVAIDTSLSPLIRRIAAAKGIDTKQLTGSGPSGRLVLADVAPSPKTVAPTAPAAGGSTATRPAPMPLASSAVPDTPHETTKLSNMRKTIARRLTESKQLVPHIYLTVDVRLDALLKLRSELNEALADRGVKLSVNDLIIKAQALALLATPACNVQHTPDQLIRFSRADISVAVSISDGLITPVIVDAGSASLSAIATSMKSLAAKAHEGRLQPSEYQGGTASLSNLGMFGIKQFEAVINPPQAMILAVGIGERRAVIDGDVIGIATQMTATGSFDHRAIDGADAAQFMSTFKALVENPLGLIG